MKKKTKRMNKDLQIIYVSAFRYALGRNSYLPGIIIEEITKVMERLDVFFLGQMASDIRHAVKHNLVDVYWVKEWTEFADRLDICSVEKQKKEMGE